MKIKFFRYFPYIVSDNGRQFKSKQFKKIINKYGIQHTYTPYYLPQANLSERYNRTLLASLRAYITNDQTLWDINLQKIAVAIRNTVQDSTKFSPYYLVFGDHKICHGSDYDLIDRLLCDREVGLHSKRNSICLAQEMVLAHLKEVYVKHSHQYNLRTKIHIYQTGQKVMVRNFVQSDATKQFTSKLAKKF